MGLHGTNSCGGVGQRLRVLPMLPNCTRLLEASPCRHLRTLDRMREERGYASFVQILLEQLSRGLRARVVVHA